MKYFLSLLLVILTIIIAVNVGVNADSLQSDTGDYLRIHIRANSNDIGDQTVKYKIRDEIINYLTPLISDCNSKEEVESIVKSNFLGLKELTDRILNENGFSYKSKIKLTEEEFPTRTYDGYTLDSGFYDAIIVELGEATGNNWWCVIYPPLCFSNFSGQNSQNIVYKSKILEMISKFFN